MRHARYCSLRDMSAVAANSNAPPGVRVHTGNRTWAKLALGAQLTREGIAAKSALAIAVLFALGFALFARGIAMRPGDSAVAEAVALASSALAWGPAVLLIIASTAHAFRRDRDAGVLALFGPPGTARAWRGYVGARTLGLAATLFVVVAGGSLVAALGASIGAFHDIGATNATLRASARFADAGRGAVASIVYAAAYAIVLAPLAAATMGARTRRRGYGILLSILILPEIFALAAGRDLPEPWRDVVSIPGALTALRSAVLLGIDRGADGDSVALAVDAAGSALFVVALYIAASLFALRREARRDPNDLAGETGASRR